MTSTPATRRESKNLEVTKFINKAAKDLESAKRNRILAVHAGREAKMPYQEIADMLGMSVSGVYRIEKRNPMTNGVVK